jgi:hypothetical protein
MIEYTVQGIGRIIGVDQFLCSGVLIGLYIHVYIHGVIHMLLPIGIILCRKGCKCGYNGKKE